MKFSTKLVLSFLILGFFTSQETIQSQTKRLKRPSSRVGIASVDKFVRESFDLYDKVYRYDGYAERGQALEDDDLEILIDAVEDAEGVLATAPNAIADLDGAGVLKQGKGTLQINRAKKALKYSLKTAKKLITEKKKQQDQTDDEIASNDPVSNDSSSGSSSQNSNSNGAASSEGSNTSKDIQIYSKFDFVPGDELLFFDDYSSDFIGDFPSKWNTNGGGEIVTVNQATQRWLKILPGFRTYYIPDLVELPDEFTIEFDVLTKGLSRRTSSAARLVILLSEDNKFTPGKNNVEIQLPFCQYAPVGMYVQNLVNGKREIYNNIAADIRQQVLNTPHISIAVNNQRFRLWVNEKKYLDVPRLLPGGGFTKYLKFRLNGFKDGTEDLFLANVKVAKGGVDLRRQLINEGKFSTNGILFDSGSAKIQPQSYGIIRQISQALQQVPEMRLNIIGHTDADGSDDANMRLSKKRADAVKDALISIYNVASDRLQTEGKGETEPVGDNKTADGKAQNRRVVFVKI